MDARNFNLNAIPFGEDKSWVRYDCGFCNVDRLVEVPDKKRALSIDMWMPMVQNRVLQDHIFISPQCPSHTVVNLKIPMNAAGVIGRFPRPEEVTLMDTIDIEDEGNESEDDKTN